MAASGGIDKALSLLRNLPRVSLQNLKSLPGTRKKKTKPRGIHSGKKCGRGHGGRNQRGTLPVLGYEGGNTPFYLQIPKEPYYAGHHVRKQYPPLSLHQLQRLVDLGRINTSQPIDLTTLCNTHVISVNTTMKHYGINLTDDGADVFKAQVNIEVQWTSETAIAAVERNGGTIITKFYDAVCVKAMSDPIRFLHVGVPIPRCALPTEDVLEYYSNPRNRGYLADPDKIQEAREELAQKYGYTLPDLSKDPMQDMLMMRKDPRQIWFGLQPGWVINFRDRNIIKPVDEDYIEYYRS